MGLKYAGFGGAYTDPRTGKITHKSRKWRTRTY